MSASSQLYLHLFYHNFHFLFVDFFSLHSFYLFGAAIFNYPSKAVKVISSVHGKI